VSIAVDIVVNPYVPLPPEFHLNWHVTESIRPGDYLRITISREDLEKVLAESGWKVVPR
jgi:hypothetical protein